MALEKKTMGLRIKSIEKHHNTLILGKFRNSFIDSYSIIDTYSLFIESNCKKNYSPNITSDDVFVESESAAFVVFVLNHSTRKLSQECFIKFKAI